MDETSGADVGGDESEEGVDDVVLAGGGAAYGEDEEVVGVVDGEVGGDVAEGGAVVGEDGLVCVARREGGRVCVCAVG